MLLPLIALESQAAVPPYILGYVNEGSLIMYPVEDYNASRICYALVAVI